ncbi:MAG TPA: ParB/RepB/Spo0J family partition protein [Gammaproteobacteria bacterium]|nr:ParB/RepB/Spo0J family partition protein [Gammaproteobacteria bacterium]
MNSSIKTKRSLGRGLNELLSGGAQLQSAAKSQLQEVPRHLPVEALQPGKYQPRREMDQEALQELAASISAQGVLQPILVRALQQNRYEIIAGERRWRAAQLVGLAEVPVFLREISDETAMAMGLIENIQREDLNALEQAVALKRLGEEFGLTHEAIAKAVGKSRVSVSNLLRLLNLEAQVQSLLEKGVLDMGHARALLSLSALQQVQLANLIVAKGLSVRATEDLARKWQSEPETKNHRSQANPDIMRLESELADKLGAKVDIKHQVKGKGRLVIHYHTLDELDGILERIR